MRTLIVCLAVLICWAPPVFAKERSPALEHELTRRAPLGAFEKPGDVPGGLLPLGAEAPACVAPATHEDAKIVENIGNAARADVETAPVEALAETAAGTIRKLEVYHPGRAEAVRPYYRYLVCLALSARGVTSGALKSALSAIDQRLAEVEAAPAAGPGNGAAADPTPAVEDAMREPDVKLAPPDEQKAIDFALKPFEDGKAETAAEQPAPPPFDAAVEPASALADTAGKGADAPAPSPSASESGKEPQEAAPSAPAAPAPESPAPDKQERRGGALEQLPAEEALAQAVSNEPAPAAGITPATEASAGAPSSETSRGAADQELADQGLGEDECIVFGAVVKCDQTNAALAGMLKAPDDFDHPKSMQLGSGNSGGKSEAQPEIKPGIAFAVQVDGKAGGARTGITEAQRGQSARLSAKLVGEGFDIKPAGLQERAAQSGQEMGGQEIRWTWEAAPVAGGPGKSLKVELYAHPVDRKGERPAVLVKTLSASIDVRGAPLGGEAGAGKAAGLNKLMGQVGGADPMVYAAAVALVFGLAVAFALVRRGRGSRPGSAADAGDVLGDLRETTGAPRPFRFTPREPSQDGGGSA